jgi:flagellar hook protein FlgE
MVKRGRTTGPTSASGNVGNWLARSGHPGTLHYSGLRLEGYNDATLTSVGDLQISPEVQVADYAIDQRGVITEYLIDGSSLVRGQILLESCTNLSLITRSGFDLYSMATNTGLWLPPGAPMTENLGWLVSGTLEVSQFDTNLLTVRSHLNFFNQGVLAGNNIPSNLAIDGAGFFTVRDPIANTLYATRWGDFNLDAMGHLETTQGWRVQGFTNGLATQMGDIIIDTTGTDYQIDMDGNIEALMPDGSELSCGQVLVQEYRNLQALAPVGDELFSNLPAAGPMITNGTLAGVKYDIQSYALEEPVPAPAPLQLPRPAGGVRLFINNLTSGTVESSTDLVHWKILGPVAGSPDLNVAEFFDTPQTIQTFYRVFGQSF